MRDKIFLVFLFCLFVAVHHIWFFNNGFLTAGDWGVIHEASIKEYFAPPYMWSNNPFSFGGANFTLSFYPTRLLYGFLAVNHVSYQFIEKVVYMWPLILTPVFIYLLIRKLKFSSLAALTGAIVYTYNTFFVMKRIDHLDLAITFAIAPFIIWLYMETLQERKLHYAVATALVAFVAGSYEFRGFYMTVMVMFLYAIYYLASNKNGFIKHLLFALAPFILILLMNVYWIYPLSKLGVLLHNQVFDRGLFGDSFLSIRDAITIHHPFWTGAKPTSFEVQPTPLYFLSIPLLAFLGLLYNRKNRYVIFFGIVSLIGIFLSKQVGAPFSFAYPWLTHHILGFAAFREGSKFFFLVGLGYAVLIAAFVDWIIKRGKQRKNELSSYIILVIIWCLFLFNALPVATGAIGGLAVSRHQPADYQKLNDFILKSPGYFRTLWVPTFSRWGIYTGNHPVIAAGPTMEGLWIKFSNYDPKTPRITSDQIINAFKKPQFDRLLAASSVKYIIIPLEDKENDDNFFNDYGKLPHFYSDALNKIPYLKKISLNTKSVVVFENVLFHPHLYIADEREDGHNSTTYKSITTNYINPTRYRVILPHRSTDYYLYFSEYFDPGWQLIINDKTITSTKSDSGYNSFYIPTRSLNGKSTIATIFFQPQTQILIPFLISLLTIILSVFCLLTVGIKNAYLHRYVEK